MSAPAARASGPLARAARDYRLIEPVLERLSAGTTNACDLLAAVRSSGLDAESLDRAFMRWAGVPARTFARHVSRSALRSRVRDAVDGRHTTVPVRMTVSIQSARRARLAQRTVAFGFGPSPFGEALLMRTDKGLCALGFVCDDDRGAAFRDLAERFPAARFEHAPRALETLARDVFDPQSDTAQLPVHLVGSEFQIDVWRALLALPSGTLDSYQALAARLGRARAARAIGSANGANPISYIVPCHRLLRASGDLGGYYFGLARKLAMIGLESVRSSADPDTALHQP